MPCIKNGCESAFRELLGDVNESNAKAMFAFAGIVVIYTFAFPHTPENSSLVAHE
jgi:hypothetical protein